MREAVIRISNCLDCPNHKEISDPGSRDSFDMADTSIICLKKDKKFISVSERPWRHRDKCSIPKWCPIVEK